jgi:hypothetical protein
LDDKGIKSGGCLHQAWQKITVHRGGSKQLNNVYFPKFLPWVYHELLLGQTFWT